MYLKSLQLKGFKSFPDRTRLSFAPGVSVIVGPNGCGKSNITDAVLWALGEQSPMAVRGSSMSDLIFAGGKGSGPRRFAEVEVVIDNGEGRANSDFSEISIKRRVDRSGESEYRLNDARCRLVDIIEALADTNLGREMHSVISQGRVEQIVSSKPRDRRLLIEESAGLGKHRKRRRNAQLKLGRTRDNLDRAIDVEREARSRLRPLKRQAEAAERGARLQREEDELRAEASASELRGAEDELAKAEKTVAESRAIREQVDGRLAEVAKRRTAIEERIAAGDRERRERGERMLEARTALERIGARRDAVAATIQQLRAGLGERQLRLEELGDGEDDPSANRVTELEAELAAINASRTPSQPGRSGTSPAAGAKPLLEMVEANEQVRPLVEALLADIWLVEDLGQIDDGFEGLAVTVEGECYDGRAGELSQVSSAGMDAGLLARSQGETVRRAQLEAELAAERRHAEAAAKARKARQRDGERLARRIETEQRILPELANLSEALESLGASLRARVEALEAGSTAEGGDEGIAAELRECSQQEFGLQTELRTAGEALTVAEVEAAQLRDRRKEISAQLTAISSRLEREIGAAERTLSEEELAEIEAKLERVERRKGQIGPVNPLAESEYSEAREHVSDLAEQRKDSEKAIRELQSLIRRTDQEIAAAFEETYEATARNFEEMVGELFPGGRGKLRRVESGPRPVPDASHDGAEGEAADDEETDVEDDRKDDSGIEIEVTPAGKSTRRLSLLSGGEKSLVALAFVFAVLLARPCPFYILDEVEAALDDINLDRFLRVVRRFADRSQFIIVTHQKRTMDAADVLYGISMGDDGITKVVSRRLPRAEKIEVEAGEGGEPPLQRFKAA